MTFRKRSRSFRSFYSQHCTITYIYISTYIKDAQLYSSIFKQKTECLMSRRLCTYKYIHEDSRFSPGSSSPPGHRNFFYRFPSSFRFIRSRLSSYGGWRTVRGRRERDDGTSRRAVFYPSLSLSSSSSSSVSNRASNKRLLPFGRGTRPARVRVARENPFTPRVCTAPAASSRAPL